MYDEEGLILQEWSSSVLWDASLVPLSLGDVPGGRAFNVALDVSDDGSRVVGWAVTDAGMVGYLWSPQAGMRPVADVLADHGLALEIEGWHLEQVTAISADGRTLVGYGYDQDGVQGAWLAQIPEPGMAPLLVLGLAGVAAHRRRARAGHPFADVGASRPARVSTPDRAGSSAG